MLLLVKAVQIGEAYKEIRRQEWLDIEPLPKRGPVKYQQDEQARC